MFKSTMEEEEVSTEIRPKLPPWLDSDEREELMSEIGEYVLSEIFDYVAEGVSPVTGKPFKELSEDYADREKGGDRKPNLDLNGDMLRALEMEVEADRIVLGIFDEDQAVKAYAHNTGANNLPKRKFMPDKSETFTREIMAGIEELIDDYVSMIKGQESDESETGG
jgi:hypothetical protein